MTIPQLKMLKLFQSQTFSISQALHLDQRTFGGLCHHKWVEYDTYGKYFHIVELGAENFERANRVHNFRKYNNGRFSVRVPRRASTGNLINFKRSA